MHSRHTDFGFVRRPALWVTLAAMTVLGLSLLVLPGNSPAPDTQQTSNNPPATIECSSKAVRPVAVSDTAEEQQVQAELRSFNDWLAANKARGFIGELGWPAEASPQDRWNQIADIWYGEAVNTSLWTTTWVTGSYWNDYNQLVYTDKNRSARGIDTPNPQARILEKYARKCGTRHGINVAGMEFGTDGTGFNNTNLGTAGVDYFHEPDATFRYLADRGITTVRLPFRWERIQPTLGGELSPKEVAQTRRILDAAHKNGQRVILDLHNYGRYELPGKTLKVGDGDLTEAQLADVWLKLGKTFGDHPGVLGYGIMNEPYDLPGGSREAQAQAWERVTQSVLMSIRTSGDKNLIIIPGYDWSSLARWQRTHPKGWISDPADNFRYEAHHYWDEDGRGTYED